MAQTLSHTAPAHPYGTQNNVFTFQLATANNQPKSSLQQPRSVANLAEKRANHNAIERARRENLNFRFQILASNIPTLAHVRKPSKSVIVQKSIEYLKEVHRRTEQRDRALKIFHDKNEQLREEVNKLRSLLGMTALPVSPEEKEAIDAMESAQAALTPTAPGSNGSSPTLPSATSSGSGSGSSSSSFGRSNTPSSIITSLTVNTAQVGAGPTSTTPTTPTHLLSPILLHSPSLGTEYDEEDDDDSGGMITPVIPTPTSLLHSDLKIESASFERAARPQQSMEETMFDNLLRTNPSAPATSQLSSSLPFTHFAAAAAAQPIPMPSSTHIPTWMNQPQLGGCLPLDAMTFSRRAFSYDDSILAGLTNGALSGT
ncbi:hypothetical protein HK102_007476 [Quaeritorhiza haematococci]|nr:hypothetical protein HK102_007476 [Quaeritorhiza haematococci]